MTRENTQIGDLLKTITNTGIWQVGLEGILEEKVTKNMESEKLARATKWGIRVFTTAALAATAWGCKNGWIPVDSTPDPTASTEIVPPTEASIALGSLNEIVSQVEKTAIIDSLPEDRPESKYGNDGTSVFKIDTENTSSKFVMYELTDEEVQNGIAVMLDGQIVVQNVALYTEREDSEGNKSWVRLIAVTVPSGEEEDGKNIVWVYDEKGFPTEGNQEVNLERPVLSYPIPNTTDQVLFSPLLPADPNPIVGWDGFNPFYVDIQGSIPGAFKVNANTTRIETPTPEVIAIPEYPVIPQEITANLPAKWNVVQETGTWYIVDQSTNSKIYRFPEAAEKWQKRNDVTVGETTYEGWIKDEASTEILTGKDAGMELIQIKNHSGGYSSLPTGFGYLKSYREVEIRYEQEKMDLSFVTFVYFLKDKKFLTIDFSADTALVERTGVDISQSLGKRFSVVVLVPPNGDFFSSDLVSKITDSNKFNKLRQQINCYGRGDFISATELFDILNSRQTEYLDLTFRLIVDQFSVPQ